MSAIVPFVKKNRVFKQASREILPADLFKFAFCFVAGVFCLHMAGLAGRGSAPTTRGASGARSSI